MYVKLESFPAILRILFLNEFIIFQFRLLNLMFFFIIMIVCLIEYKGMFVRMY